MNDRRIPVCCLRSYYGRRKGCKGETNKGMSTRDRRWITRLYLYRTKRTFRAPFVAVVVGEGLPLGGPNVQSDDKSKGWSTQNIRRRENRSERGPRRIRCLMYIWQFGAENTFDARVAHVVWVQDSKVLSGVLAKNAGRSRGENPRQELQ